jgi:hypothetical protein
VTLTDEWLTGMFGPKCPECGWREGKHRPPITLSDMPVCTAWAGNVAGTGT